MHTVIPIFEIVTKAVFNSNFHLRCLDRLNAKIGGLRILYIEFNKPGFTISYNLKYWLMCPLLELCNWIVSSRRLSENHNRNYTQDY
jgi:hypothetical protein